MANLFNENPIAAIFMVITILGGAALVVSMVLQPVVAPLFTLHWDQTPCVIKRSWAGNEFAEADANAEIRYTYTYGGIEHTSENISPAWLEMGGGDALVEAFPEGSQRVCYVNPSDPSQAILTRRVGIGEWIAFFMLGLPSIIIALALAKVGWNRLRAWWAAR